MPSAVNASPTKIYIMLFAIVVVGYVAYIIMRSLKHSSVEVEHFVEEHPNYKNRMEVMKVFDLYLNRNPSSEELEKYSIIKNEQDILLSILNDFQINVNDVNPTKIKYIEEEQVQEEFIENLDNPVENVEYQATTDNNITISRITFEEIKMHIKSLYDIFSKLDN